jgi:hypothetical protein
MVQIINSLVVAGLESESSVSTGLDNGARTRLPCQLQIQPVTRPLIVTVAYCCGLKEHTHA